MSAKIPIACSLTDRELQERRKSVLQKVGQSLLEVYEIEDGYNYRFPVEDFILQELVTVIALERKCCSFLNFKLNLEAQSEFISLELTGQTGTKEIIRALFDWK